MKHFVFWTGILDILAGLGCQISQAFALVVQSEPVGLTTHLFGLVAIFLGIMLILCARDLQRRGTFVVWEGLLRVAGFAVFAGYGILGKGGVGATLCGVADLAIGMVYLVWLPRYLAIPLKRLLMDAPAEAGCR